MFKSKLIVLSLALGGMALVGCEQSSETTAKPQPTPPATAPAATMPATPAAPTTGVTIPGVGSASVGPGGVSVTPAPATQPAQP